MLFIAYKEPLKINFMWNTSGKKQSQRVGFRIKQRLRQRQIMIRVAGISAGMVMLFIAVHHFLNTREASAVAVNDYRTVGSGNWSNPAIWEYYDGSGWTAATAAPNSGASIITIQSGNTVTVNTTITADQIEIEAGGTLSVMSGITLTIANGTGTDLINDGTVTNTGTITLSSGATAAHRAGAQYTHSRNGGDIPLATWDSTSTCNITAVTNTMPTQIQQNFGNLTWNCTAQSTALAFNCNMSIQGTFTISRTGSSTTTPLVLNSSSNNYTFTVGRNWIQNRGVFRGTTSTGGATINVLGDLSLNGTRTTNWFYSSSGTGVCNCIIGGSLLLNNGLFCMTEASNTVSLSVGASFVQTGGEFVGAYNAGISNTTISGNFILSGSTSSCFCTITYGSGLSTMQINGYASITGANLYLTQGTNNGILRIKGNYTHSAGTVTETAATNTGEIEFNGTAMQLCAASSAATNSINFTVKTGAWLHFSTESMFLQSGGKFTLESGSRLGIQSPNGITSTGPNGHILVSGLRSYSTGATYDYTGINPQNTGNGIPSTVRNLIIDNDAGIQLDKSVVVTGRLTLDNGILTTDTNTVTLGTSTLVNGILSRTYGHVNGIYRCWTNGSSGSNLVFPIGTLTDYNGVILNIVNPASGGLITSEFSTGYPGHNGLPILDAGDLCSTIGSGWWSLTGSNGFSGGKFDIDVIADGFTGIIDISFLHLFLRSGSSIPWSNPGTHVPASGTVINPVVSRANITQLGQFGIVSTEVNPLPVTMLYFQAKPEQQSVKVSWATSSERNSDFFIVQRAADGKNYTDIGRVTAAGESNTLKKYNFTDMHPKSGISYYRLHQFDRDGKSEIFGPEVVRFGETKKSATAEFTSLSLWPNPFHETLTMRFECTTECEQPLTIYNMQGAAVTTRLITITPGVNTVQMPEAEHLPTGQYIIEIGQGATIKRTRAVKL